MKKDIPRKFWHAGEHPVVRNVGELKRELALLPDDLAVGAELSDTGAEVVVYNTDYNNPFLELRGLEDEEAE